VDAYTACLTAISKGKTMRKNERERMGRTEGAHYCTHERQGIDRDKAFTWERVEDKMQCSM
jgi:hypothetical protein